MHSEWQAASNRLVSAESSQRMRPKPAGVDARLRAAQGELQRRARALRAERDSLIRLGEDFPELYFQEPMLQLGEMAAYVEGTVLQKLFDDG